MQKLKGLVMKQGTPIYVGQNDKGKLCEIVYLGSRISGTSVMHELDVVDGERRAHLLVEFKPDPSFNSRWYATIRDNGLSLESEKGHVSCNGWNHGQGDKSAERRRLFGYNAVKELAKMHGLELVLSMPDACGTMIFKSRQGIRP